MPPPRVDRGRVVCRLRISCHRLRGNRLCFSGRRCAAGVRAHGIERIAPAVIWDPAVYARLAVPDPVLLEEGDGAVCLIDGFDNGVVIAVALPCFSGGIGDIAGLRRVCNLEPIACRTGGGDIAVVRVDVHAVDGAVKPFDQLIAEQRCACLIIQRVHAAEGVGDEALSHDCDIIQINGRLGGQRRYGQQCQT